MLQHSFVTNAATQWPPGQRTIPLEWPWPHYTGTQPQGVEFSHITKAIAWSWQLKSYTDVSATTVLASLCLSYQTSDQWDSPSHSAVGYAPNASYTPSPLTGSFPGSPHNTGAICCPSLWKRTSVHSIGSWDVVSFISLHQLQFHVIVRYPEHPDEP